MPTPIALQFAQQSDPGRVRRTNDDTSLAETLYLPDGRCLVLAAIADGMGGLPHGRAASELAIQASVDFLRGALQHPPRDERSWTLLLQTAVARANESVRAHHQSGATHDAMGTTLMLTVVLGRRARIAHIGDSRAYVVRPAVRRPHITQLTADHTVAAALVAEGALSYAEAAEHPQRHTLSQAIGLDDQVQAEITARTLRANERLLLCSDGLTLHVSDNELARTVTDAATPDAACHTLIDLANARGGRDNITAVVIAAATPPSTATS